MTASGSGDLQTNGSKMRLLSLFDVFTRPVLFLIVTVIDNILTPIQRRVGTDKMGYFFVLPNLLIFGIFVLFPMLLNFYYAMTGGNNLYLHDRPFIGLGNFENPFFLKISWRQTVARRTFSGAASSTPFSLSSFKSAASYSSP